MLVVETIAKIRRAYFSQGKSIKEICRDLRISRKVVRKVIRRPRPSFATNGGGSRCPGSGRGGSGWTGCLKGTRQKAARERLTLIRIFEELRGLGFDRQLRGGAALCARAGARAHRARRRRPIFR